MTEPKGVPKYDETVFAAKRSRYCLCIFVINEGNRIQEQLNRSAGIAQDIDILIADGGSTDGSLEPDFLKANGVRALLVRREKGQLGTQMRMAMHFALGEGYKGVIVMDGNNKDDPDHALRFVEALDQGYDHIQGSRYIPGGQAVNTPLTRDLAIKLVHAPLISLAAHKRYTDTTNGFRAYSHRLMTAPQIDLFRPIFTGYELHYYLAIRAARIGLKVTEIPVSRSYPKTGKTPTKITPFKGNLTVMLKLFKAVFGRFDPQTTRTERSAR